jgi:hypothetical protein
LNKRRIALIGAFDRNNYGDVFMPIILEEVLGENYSFDYYALKDFDLTDVGGKKGRSLKKISDYSYDASIIVGGEVLSASYSGMIKNIEDNTLILFFYRVLNKLFPLSFEKLAKKILNGETINPWVYCRKRLSTDKIIYNTVGGRGIKFDKAYIDDLKESNFISVRDEQTKLELSKNGIRSFLYPDSVSIISRVFPKEKVEKIVTSELREKVKMAGNYFVFQINKSTGRNNIEELAFQIDQIVKETNLSCILLPIGYAQGHEDFVPLKKIKELSKSEKVFFFEEKNIYSILFILANSSLYVGTSLHGAITSMSYAIPHMALTNSITKLTDYIKTWKSSPIIYTSIGDLNENVKKLFFDMDYRNDIKEISSRVVKLSEENFSKISEVIMSSVDEEN